MSAFTDPLQSDDTSSAHPAQEVALIVQPKVGFDKWALRWRRVSVKSWPCLDPVNVRIPQN